MENSIDSSPVNGYNTGLDDTNGVEIVKMDEQRPINDTECEHKEFVIDPKDRIGEAVYHGCTNPRCGLGFYQKNKNIT